MFLWFFTLVTWVYAWSLDAATICNQVSKNPSLMATDWDVVTTDKWNEAMCLLWQVVWLVKDHEVRIKNLETAVTENERCEETVFASTVWFDENLGYTNPSAYETVDLPEECIDKPCTITQKVYSAQDDLLMNWYPNITLFYQDANFKNWTATDENQKKGSNWDSSYSRISWSVYQWVWSGPDRYRIDLFDDYNPNYGGETEPYKITLRDASAAYYQELSACIYPNQTDSHQFSSCNLIYSTKWTSSAKESKSINIPDVCIDYNVCDLKVDLIKTSDNSLYDSKYYTYSQWYAYTTDYKASWEIWKSSYNRSLNMINGDSKSNYVINPRQSNWSWWYYLQLRDDYSTIDTWEYSWWIYDASNAYNWKIYLCTK